MTAVFKKFVSISLPAMLLAAAAFAQSASITSPSPGSTLAGRSVTFVWSPGTGADGYWLEIGDSQGIGSIYSGFSNGTSRTVDNVPCDSRALNVRLTTHRPAGWDAPNSYSYTAGDCSSDPRAILLTPTPGSQFTRDLVTFSWTAGVNADAYFLSLGNTPDGNDIAYFFTRERSLQVPSLPLDGRTIYVALWTHLPGGYYPAPSRYTFTASRTHAGDMNFGGKADLVWQDAARRVAVWYMGGVKGNQFQSFGWIDWNGVPGWRVVALADLDGEGHSDIIWTEDGTGRVAVWYMGGPGGNVFQSFGWISSAGVPGWNVVAVTDINGDGHPDVILQEESTRRVWVWYMGGAQGNVVQSQGWIFAYPVPGWRVVSLADLNGDGRLDVIWQEDATRRLAAWYMAGAMGDVFHHFGWIEPNGVPGWSAVGVNDLDGDSRPDIVWRQDGTGMLAAWYLGGAQGNLFGSFEWIANFSMGTWLPAVPR